MGGALDNLAIVFARARTFRQLGLGDPPAIQLGMNAMRSFRKVSIDFTNLRLRVLPPETAIEVPADAARNAFRSSER